MKIRLVLRTTNLMIPPILPNLVLDQRTINQPIRFHTSRKCCTPSQTNATVLRCPWKTESSDLHRPVTFVGRWNVR
jgi:hypothetical protein